MLVSRACRQRGLTLVELLIGITVAMFIVAAAAYMLTNQLGQNRRLLLEAQVEQELRAAADLITRDLRRSGYWGNAATQVTDLGAQANPFANTFNVPSSTQVSYSYSQGSEDNAVAATEGSGFQLSDGVLRMQLSDGNWQPLTDPNVVRVTAFNVDLNTQNIDLHPLYCPIVCIAGCAPGLPTQQLRNVTVYIGGQAQNDASVMRDLRVRVRLRNDNVTGACPDVY